MKTEKTCMNCGTSGCDHKDTRVCASSGSRSLWTPEEKNLRDGEPCGHPGCLHHVSHPCEGCGRIAGRLPYNAEGNAP